MPRSVIMFGRCPAGTAPLLLIPPASRVDWHAHGLGLFPFDSGFNLKLRDEAHPFSPGFDGSRSGKTLKIGGLLLHRADWGMTARPFAAAPGVRACFAFPGTAVGPLA